MAVWLSEAPGTPRPLNSLVGVPMAFAVHYKQAFLVFDSIQALEITATTLLFPAVLPPPRRQIPEPSAGMFFSAETCRN
jgi:hypothetical protein